MLISFPVALSPSPVHHAFDGIHGEPLDTFTLSRPEKSLIRKADENVLEYTLQEPSDAHAYALILLKLLDSVTSASKDVSTNAKIHTLPLDIVLPVDEAHALLHVDLNGILTHYLVQRLCDVVLILRKPDNGLSKRTLASVFYPDGILLGHARSLLRVLMARGPTDAFIQRGAAMCLACILMQGQELAKEHRLLSPVTSVLDSFVSWIISRLQSGSAQSITVLSPALTIIITDQRTRELLDAAGGIGYLARNLQSKQCASVQQIYELLYCLWVLSYDVNENEALRHHFHRDGAIPALVDLVVAAPREKVVRVALSSLCNMATCDPQHTASLPMHKRSIDGRAFLTEMVGCGLTKALEILKQRTWKDEEFIKDLNELSKLLRAMEHDMTRWDVYVAEVNSGHLQWGLMHTERFFKENAKLMEGPDGDFSIVKRLIQLAASDNEEVAAIACFDIGEFARFYPNGRPIAKRLGVRNIVMHLMDSPNDELRRQALLCVSKILVQNWQHVS